MFDLSGKTALVTGASGGIGRDIARCLHQAGAKVGLAGTREQVLQELAGELGKALMHWWLTCRHQTVQWI